MRFATRAFAFCFIALAILLGVSFWTLQSMVRKSVREELRSVMRDQQVAMARIRARNEAHISRFVRFVTENAPLKAGLHLLNAEPLSAGARRGVESQLRELSTQIGCPLLAIANFKGTPLVWILRGHHGADIPALPPASFTQGLAEINGELYHLISVPIGQGPDNPGVLTIGDRFDLSEFGLPVVLFHGGRIVRTSYAEASPEQLAKALKPCIATPECDVRLNGTTYLSLQLKDSALGEGAHAEGYVLRSLQNVDAAATPLHAALKQVFLTAAIAACMAAFIFSAAASSSIVRPLAAVISRLKKSEEAGLLLKLPADDSRIAEIRDLINSYNSAAASICDAHDRLHGAYVQFIQSLANALDARDRYTAGHSQRVSQLSAEIAEALGMSPEEQQTVRMGALLHDIGKIGIPDYILRKPGVLSDHEFAFIKQHPTIGRRILEGVNGFSPYLAAVELHHENWDGTGYPRGLREREIPVAARIVHVADAWDAMTTDRPYRSGFSRERALAAIRINAGTQFDPEIAAILTRLVQLQVPPRETAEDDANPLLALAAAVAPERALETEAESEQSS